MSGGRLRRVTVVLILALTAIGGCTDGAGSRIRESPHASPFTPVADTYVDSGSPPQNYGTSPELFAGGSPVRRVFIMFRVSGLSAPVTSARLRIHVRDTENGGSTGGGRVVRVPDRIWSETAVTFDNQPDIDGTVLATLDPVPRGTWHDVDVASVVTGNGAYSFGIVSSSDDDARYDSRESGANAPRLIVTTGGSSPDPVLVGAGDIATCKSSGDEATATLLDGIAGTVFTAGDHAYNKGSPSEFECYAASWGRHRHRTRPAPGNHDYRTRGAKGYFDYFGARAGDPARGYYSYDLGAWHVVALNSNCSEVGGCQAGSPQETWLRADLAASLKRCTVAYWHHPLFTSGANHPPKTEMRPIFRALYDHGAEIVVAGHNHNYERFAPQDPDGGRDDARGIRAFVAGTGGKSHYRFADTQPNSEVRNSDTSGVLAFTLRADGYDWTFVPESGKRFSDSGSGRCH